MKEQKKIQTVFGVVSATDPVRAFRGIPHQPFGHYKVEVLVIRRRERFDIGARPTELEARVFRSLIESVHSYHQPAALSTERPAVSACLTAELEGWSS